MRILGEGMRTTERMTGAAVAVICLLLIAGVIVYLDKARERILDRNYLEAATLVETISQHAERSIHEVDLSLQAIVDAELARVDTTKLQSLLAEYSRRLPQVSQLAVFDPSGQVKADSRPDRGSTIFISMHQAFRDAAAVRFAGLHLGSPTDNPLIGSWTITLSRRIEATDGRLLGLVVAQVRFDHFSEFYQSLAFQGPTTILSLLDGRTRLLVRYPARPDLLGQPLADDRVLDAAIEQGRRAEIAVLTMLDGGARHAYVRQVGRFPIFAMVAVDEDTLLRPWRIEVIVFALVLLFLVTVIGGAGWLVVRQMARTRQSERDLARHAAWLGSVIENIDHGVAVFDGDTRLVAWNRNAERLLGLPEGKFEVGRRFFDLVRSNGQWGELDDAEVAELIRARLAAATGPDGEMYDFNRPDGAVVEIRRTPMPSGGFVSTYRDVTADRQASRDLEQRAEILRILHSVAQAANEAPDLASAMRRALRLIATGAGWPVAVAHRLVEGSEPVLAPVHWYLAEGERYAAFKEASAGFSFRRGEGLAGAILETGKPLTVEDLMQDPRFQAKLEAQAAGLSAAFAVPILERRRVIGALVFFSDQRFTEDYFLFAVLDSISAQISRVAERERSEASLRARELRLRSIFEAVDEGLFTINESGSIESLNPAAEAMFRTRSEDALRRDLRHFFVDGETRFPDPGIIDRLSRFRSGSGGELQGRRADGSLFPVEIAARELHLEDRRLAVVVVRDITERRRIEWMKNQFVSTVSHELRTPLTSIAGSLGLLAGGVVGDVPAPVKQMIDIAQSNCNRLVLLINDILDLEKIEAGRMDFAPREVDVWELARQAIEANRSYAEQYKVELRLGDRPDGCRANVDPDRIMQVFNNLLSNAAKFSPASGVVDVTVRPDAASSVRVEVADRGPGIPEAFQSRVFEKFSQADATDSRAKGGTGLGLSIVKTIVERSGGQVGFTSKAGEGTTFWFELPAAQAVSDDAGALDAQPCQRQADATANALCFVGKGENAEKILRVLQLEGFTPVLHETLEDLRQAIDETRADLIVVDLDIAGSEGVDLLQALRGDSATREIPVVPVATRPTIEQVDGSALAIGDWLRAPLDERRVAEALWAVFDDDSSPARVLHVEDDPDIVEVVRVALRGSALVHAVPGLDRARALLREEVFDVVLLDLDLEDGNGADLIPAVSGGLDHPIPVILFSASEPPKHLIDHVAQSLSKSKTSLDALRRTVGQIARRSRRRTQKAAGAGAITS